MAAEERGRILVVDDEVEHMTVLVEMLSAQGFDAVGFTSGAQAIEALEQRDFDLMLSDLMMPQMDGISLLRAALAIDPHLVGILMTGQGTVQTAVDAMKGGAFDYILKPFKLQTLMPVLARGLQMRRLRDENLNLRDTLATHELGQAVCRTLDLPSIVEKLADAAQQQLQADEISVLLAEPGERELSVAAVRGAERECLLGQRVDAEHGPAGWVARNLQPLTLVGPVSDPRFEPAYPRAEIQSSVLHPLIFGGKLVGTLCANSLTTARQPTHGETKALDLLASMAGAAIENASLYAGARRAEAEANEAARALEESETLYRSVVENLSEGIVISSGLTVRFVNEAFLRIHGLSDASAVVGTPRDLLVAEEDRERLRESIFAREAGDLRKGQIEYRALRPGGEERVVHASGTRIVHDGEPAALAVLHDVTEQRQAETALKQSEDRLRQAQKMEAIGLLAGGIAHDFNNLLTAIIGFSALVDQELPEGSPLKTYVGEIMKAGDSAANLTSQILAFSRRQILAPERLSLNSVVADMAKLCQRVLGENIRLETRLDSGLGAVMADRGQMEQVIMNLAVNARDAMPGGGRLTIETENVDVDDEYLGGAQQASFGLTPGTRYARITVSDSGYGMDRETQAKIFEPFFTTKEPGKGTGLGLATVYGIVKQSGGDIWVYSEPGLGTSFKIYLPTQEAEGTEHQATAPSIAPGGHETVLLVEDEASVRSLARAVLEAKGYHLLEAGSGEDGLRIAEEYDGPIELLVTDLVLPGITGRELAERLLEARPDTRVLYTSGYTDDVAVRHGILSAQLHFLQKPYTPSSLARKAREALDRAER